MLRATRDNGWQKFKIKGRVENNTARVFSNNSYTKVPVRFVYSVVKEYTKIKTVRRHLHLVKPFSSRVLSFLSWINCVFVSGILAFRKQILAGVCDSSPPKNRVCRTLLSKLSDCPLAYFFAGLFAVCCFCCVLDMKIKLFISHNTAGIFFLPSSVRSRLNTVKYCCEDELSLYLRFLLFLHTQVNKQVGLRWQTFVDLVCVLQLSALLENLEKAHFNSTLREIHSM